MMMMMVGSIGRSVAPRKAAAALLLASRLLAKNGGIQ
jgi:hypothetical protein